MMTHRGHQAKVEFDYDAGVFHGEVINTRDVIFFEGTTVDELIKEFRFSIDDYLAMCAERGQEPDRPYSGKVALRMSSETHQAATTAAQAEEKSLNAWLADTIERAVREAT